MSHGKEDVKHINTRHTKKQTNKQITGIRQKTKSQRHHCQNQRNEMAVGRTHRKLTDLTNNRMATPHR